MTSNLNHIPHDPDTTILFEQQGVFDDIPACYQSWHLKNCHSNGISGESIIFLKKDLKQHKIKHLIQKVKASHLVQNPDQVTKKQKSDYLFINFNFKKS